MRNFVLCSLICRVKRAYKYDICLYPKSLNLMDVHEWEKVIHISIPQTDNIALNLFPMAFLFNTLYLQNFKFFN